MTREERMEQALRWFADPRNWRRDEVSEGAIFEWLPGFSPIEFAKHSLKDKPK